MRYAKIMFAVLLVSGSVNSTTIHVPADQPTIQAGIDATVDGDTVLVEDGLYSGLGNTGINPQGKSVVVKSVGGYENCVIEMNNSGGGVNSGFLCMSGEDTSTVFKGFTVRASGVLGRGLYLENASILVEDCRFLQCGEFPGGAVYARHALLVARNCIFKTCYSNFGGASSLDSSSALFDSCVFDSNWAYRLNSSAGGAIWMSPTSDADIRNCSFRGNYSTEQQPTADTRGGAIYCAPGSKLQLDRSTLVDNFALYGMGGAIFAEDAQVTISASTFASNGHRNLPPNLSAPTRSLDVGSTAFPQSFASGGAIYAMFGRLDISNCMFSSNQAPYVQGLATKYRGGAICSDRCTTLISGSTFVDNAARTGYAVFALESDLKIDSSIIAFNREIYPGIGAPVACDTFSNISVSVTCTDIYGNPNGDWLELVDSLENLYDNFSLDPQFCGRTVGNFYLQEDSPCRPELSSCGSLVGALPVEPGCSSCCEGATGNANLVGTVDISDLSLLIAYLTVAPPPVIPCGEEANVNATGSIDLSDLSAMIAFITAGTYSLPWCP